MLVVLGLLGWLCWTGCVDWTGCVVLDWLYCASCTGLVAFCWLYFADCVVLVMLRWSCWAGGAGLGATLVVLWYHPLQSSVQVSAIL